MEIRKSRSCFLGIVLISKWLKLGGPVVFTRTCCFYKDILFQQWLCFPPFAQTGSPKESTVNRSFLAFCFSHPQHLPQRYRAAKSLFVTSESGEISPEQNISSLTQKGDLEQVAQKGGRSLIPGNIPVWTEV